MSKNSYKTSTLNGQEAVILSLDTENCQAEVEIYLHGAHVTKWTDSNSNIESLIYTSEKAIFDGKKAIRGGIPICFPQFSNTMNYGKSHGFARNSKFSINDKYSAITNDSVTVALELHSSADTKNIWPHNFIVLYLVKLYLGKDNHSELSLELNVTNKNDTDNFTITAALHTYFSVSDINHVTISGLSGLNYLDKTKNDQSFKQEAKDLIIDQEIDRKYYDTPNEIILNDLITTKKVYVITNNSLPDTVVWNPWKKTILKYIDFDPIAFNKFVCIEAAVINNPITILPNKNWKGNCIIKWN